MIAVVILLIISPLLFSFWDQYSKEQLLDGFSSSADDPIPSYKPRNKGNIGNINAVKGKEEMIKGILHYNKVLNAKELQRCNYSVLAALYHSLRKVKELQQEIEDILDQK